MKVINLALSKTKDEEEIKKLIAMKELAERSCNVLLNSEVIFTVNE